MVYSGRSAQSADLPNLELLLLLAQPLKTAVLVTDARIERPGPFITFANQAFLDMSGYKLADLIGRSPRLLQAGVRRTAQFDEVGRSLKHGRRYHGVLKNTRADGEPYFCEVDIRPLLDGTGHIGGYIAFEREARRRKGRPASRHQTRFQPLLEETADELPGIFEPKAN